MEERLSYRRSIWISSLIALVGLGLFVGVSALIPQPGGDSGLLLLGLFLALIPALIWLGFFYQQDRDDPEPRTLVARTFVFGALAAAAVAVPVGGLVASQTISQAPGLLVRLILTILSVSLLQEVLKLAMVRYVVLGTSEFDEHPDGIVYGLASGLGFATVLTVAMVLQSGGMRPLAGAIQAVDNALVHGALGAVSGYYIGRVKIDGKKVPWLLQGLAVVTVLNGLYQVISSELSRRLTFNPWYSLAVAAGLALVVGVVLFAFFRRALRRARGDLTTISITAHARSKEMPWDIKTRYDWVLIGALALALAVGLGAGPLLNLRTVAYQDAGLSAEFRYPAGWAVQSSGTGGGVTLRNLTAPGVFRPLLRVGDSKVSSDASLELLIAEYRTVREQQSTLFTETWRGDATSVAGLPAIRSEYQYAVQTGSGPVVVQGVETFVLAGPRLLVFTFEAESAAFASGLRSYERLLSSVSITAGGEQ